MLREWEKLPKFMQTEEVRPYYDSLKKKKISFISEAHEKFYYEKLKEVLADE